MAEVIEVDDPAHDNGKARSDGDRTAELEQRVATLEATVSELTQRLDDLARGGKVDG